MFRLIIVGSFIVIMLGTFVRAKDGLDCTCDGYWMSNSDSLGFAGRPGNIFRSRDQPSPYGHKETCSDNGSRVSYEYRSYLAPGDNDGKSYVTDQYIIVSDSCKPCDKPKVNDPAPISDGSHSWFVVYSLNTCGEEVSTPAYTNTSDASSWYIQVQGACCALETYYKSCPVGQIPDKSNPDMCVLDPDSNNTCPPGMHNISTDSEILKCACDNGLPALYDPVTHNQTCQKPACPPSVGSLPLKEQGITEPLCKAHAGNNDVFTIPYSFLRDPKSSLTCCYYDADPSKCPKNEVYLDGKCIPISHNPDDNGTNPDHTCPTDQYWSINQNKCVPFYNSPDKNDSGGNGSSNGAGGSGNSDNNGSGGVGISVSSKDSNISVDVNVSLDLNETNDILRDINASLNRDFSGVLKDLNKKYSKMGSIVDNMTSSYRSNFSDIKATVTTLHVPHVHFSGSCSLGFTALGKHIDLSKGLKMLIPVLRPILMLILNIYFSFLMIKLSVLAYKDISLRITGLFQ